MSSKDKEPIANRAGDKEKKTYRPPSIIYRETLEAVAGACSVGGKADGGSCPAFQAS